MLGSLWTKPYLKETLLSIYKVMYDLFVMHDLFHRVPRIEVYRKITAYLSYGISTSANMDVMNEVRARVHAEDGIPDVLNTVTPVITEKINEFT
jgi:hypothetical protein